MKNSHIRLVPKESVSRAQVLRMAERACWEHYRTKDAPGGPPFEIIWVNSEQDAVVHWIEDALSQVDYFLVDGPGKSSLVKLIRSELDIHDKDSMVELAYEARGTPRAMRMLRLLGVFCSEGFDPDIFSIFDQALRDPEPIVRREALMSAANAGWGEFLPLMDEIRESDPDKAVREDAGAISDALRRRLEAGRHS
ncbi:hypothetical protein ACLIYM_01630 [Streptomyces fenghuangensis]|uniref:hypothetical protein n=1 Tax=Streptomyces sp. ICN903 TaxID=2964654 RepID=UPI001EDC3C0F|nr:hypothetical protein [Streptomyces sp. ICN903]MCG3041075.1 hypothetical protein [Streptomyces sp. ICN903]